MAQLTINIDNQGQPYTVAEMRKHLAQVLSKLNGDQTVTFSFRANLPEYRPAYQIYPGRVINFEAAVFDEGITIAHGPLAAPENN